MTPTRSAIAAGCHRPRGFATRLALTGVLVAFPLLAQAQQPGRPATLEEALAQIEALKKQMSELEKFVREQAQQRGVTTLGGFVLKEFRHNQLVRVLRLLPAAKLELEFLGAGLDDKL